MSIVQFSFFCHISSNIIKKHSENKRFISEMLVVVSYQEEEECESWQVADNIEFREGSWFSYCRTGPLFAGVLRTMSVFYNRKLSAYFTTV